MEKNIKEALPENYTIRYYHELNCSFWDSSNRITRQYKIKKEEQSNEQTSSANTNKYDDYYEMLMNQKFKDNYLQYLFRNFIFSQPNSLTILKNNFFNYVFPAYIFSIYSPKNNLSRIVFLDYTIFTLIFYDQGSKMFSIQIDKINHVKIQDNQIILMTTAKDNTQTSILFKPAISTQCELVYILIRFMSQLKEQLTEEKQVGNTIQENSIESNGQGRKRGKCVDKVIRTEEKINLKDLIAIKNDYYVPSGIVFRAKVFIDKTKGNGDNERYMTLGSSFIGIFKDDTMEMLMYMIPLIPSYVLISFDKEKNLMKVTVPENEINVFFQTVDEMEIWQIMIYDLADGKIEEKITDDILSTFILDPLYFNPSIDLEETWAMKSINQQIEDLEIKLEQLKSKSEESGKKETSTKSIKDLEQSIITTTPKTQIEDGESPIIDQETFDDFFGSIKTEINMNIFDNWK